MPQRLRFVRCDYSLVAISEECPSAAWEWRPWELWGPPLDSALLVNSLSEKKTVGLMNGEYIESTYGSIPMKYHHCFTIVSPCLTLLCSKLQYHLAIDRWGYQKPINAHRIHGAAILMVTWIPSIYPSHVSITTSTMDPSWDVQASPWNLHRIQHFSSWWNRDIKICMQNIAKLLQGGAPVR